MLDLNRRSTKREEMSERINALIDANLTAENAKRPRREYLGTSYLGGPCARAVQFEYAGEPHDEPFPGQTLRIFERGHQFEDMAAAWVRAAGFHLLTHKRGGGQFGFEDAGGRFKGHVDGVIVEGPPEFAPYPFLWEHKGLNHKNWTGVVNKGVTVATPTYAAQVAVYQAQLGLMEAPALFTVTNANTMQLFHERVPFDPGLAQQMIDRAVTVIRATEAGEVLPRVSREPDNYICNLCSFKARCWSYAV